MLRASPPPPYSAQTRFGIPRSQPLRIPSSTPQLLVLANRTSPFTGPASFPGAGRFAVAAGAIPLRSLPSNVAPPEPVPDYDLAPSFDIPRPDYGDVDVAPRSALRDKENPRPDYDNHFRFNPSVLRFVAGTTEGLRPANGGPEAVRIVRIGCKPDPIYRAKGQLAALKDFMADAASWQNDKTDLRQVIGQSELKQLWTAALELGAFNHLSQHEQNQLDLAGDRFAFHRESRTQSVDPDLIDLPAAPFPDANVLFDVLTKLGVKPTV